MIDMADVQAERVGVPTERERERERLKSRDEVATYSQYRCEKCSRMNAKCLIQNFFPQCFSAELRNTVILEKTVEMQSASSAILTSPINVPHLVKGMHHLRGPCSYWCSPRSS